MRQGGVDAVHVTIAYHETFRETVANIEEWNRYFSAYPELIVHACSAADVRAAREQERTAIIFGFQNCYPIYQFFGAENLKNSKFHGNTGQKPIVFERGELKYRVSEQGKTVPGPEFHSAFNAVISRF